MYSVGINENKHSMILRKNLASVCYDKGCHSEAGQSIDVLDQWIGEAWKYLDLKRFDEAMLICKAIIEEYSQWLFDAGKNVSYMFSREYQVVPFDIIAETAEYCGKKDLFDYCLLEMKKKKYKGTFFSYCFHRLFANLALAVSPDAFIALQDELLAGIKDKSSVDAETVLERKIGFYERLGKDDEARSVLEENIQIKSFRLKLINILIEAEEFSAAKELINEFVDVRKNDSDKYADRIFYKLLLNVAQKEKDMPVVQKLSYGFIKNNFNDKYYNIYKSTFEPSEWGDEYKRLVFRYSREKNLSDSLAGLLTAENDAERLIDYMENRLSLHEIGKYYKVFVSVYPERTLELFRKAIVFYAENNAGRSHYQKIFSELKKMLRIKGGEKVVQCLVEHFRIHYKNRSAMMEVLGGC